MKYIYELHKIMVERNLILVYEGEFTQEITKSVLAMAERNMDAGREDSSVKRKVFNVMVECLQNIVKYSNEIDFEDAEGQQHHAVFMVGKHEDVYTITSGNMVTNDRVKILQDKIEHINSLDKDGLKALYKEIIKTGEINVKGGAGLGFIDMARKSGEKLQFDFEPMNDKISFFSLKTVVPRKES
ncbi:SiaB family protein kinase [Eisenibacter elegans]|jgi:hypothetical protein|uniref:SiaB family protein kinase n=1 Tax=Eisenibacter elegans TaxID=997 RepID=UPI0004125606|nr:SiaB family protein kinase [Eisenibacter elegans]